MAYTNSEDPEQTASDHSSQFAIPLRSFRNNYIKSKYTSTSL